jgi:hypothetical protein
LQFKRSEQFVWRLNDLNVSDVGGRKLFLISWSICLLPQNTNLPRFPELKPQFHLYLLMTSFQCNRSLDTHFCWPPISIKTNLCPA